MTIIIENASFSFTKAIRELAKIDGAKVRTEKKLKPSEYFYSDENMAVLKQSLNQLADNKVVVHEPIEVKCVL